MKEAPYLVVVVSCANLLLSDLDVWTNFQVNERESVPAFG